MSAFFAKVIPNVATTYPYIKNDSWVMVRVTEHCDRFEVFLAPLHSTLNASFKEGSSVPLKKVKGDFYKEKQFRQFSQWANRVYRGIRSSNLSETVTIQI